MKIGNILKKARIDSGLTLREVKEQTGISQSALSQIELGEVKLPSFMRVAALAKLYNLSLNGLYEAASDESEMPSVLAKTLQSKHIPLVSWVQAGSWSDSPTSSHNYKMISSPFSCSDNAYALEVKGESMTAGSGSKYNFPEGSIIIVDPDVEAQHRSFVIAMIDGTNDITFKRLNLEDGKFLQPLNPIFPVIPIDRPITFCGVVVGVLQSVN